MAKINKRRRIASVSVVSLIVFLATVESCTVLKKSSENEPPVSQPKVTASQSRATKLPTQPIDKLDTLQPQSTSDKSGSQILTPNPKGIPPGYSSEIIQVKFREGTDVHLPQAVLPPELRSSVMSINRLFSLSDQELSKQGHDLSLWFKITLKPRTDAAAFIEALKRLDSVETVEPAPLPAPPP